MGFCERHPPDVAVGTHAPLSQTSTAAHAWPQLPQSCCVPSNRPVSGQVQLLPLQAVPPRQASPQKPHAPFDPRLKPPGQSEHTPKLRPPVQACIEGHAEPQMPQLLLAPSC